MAYERIAIRYKNIKTGRTYSFITQEQADDFIEGYAGKHNLRLL